VRRSLVLAGGGMRVAWQTGVVAALTEHGLRFDHVDGTSGGIMTAGMLLSGQGRDEMARRWSDLDVQAFSSLLPVKSYLQGPWSLPALGDADGIRDTVFPHLGIDVDAIRSSPVEGTFNLVDFVTKTCVALPHTEVDAELLAAGMSLPIAMPPVRRGERVWTDAVWVKDANVTEALRRGADEVWLVWCIGNSARWGDGPLEQYVHMIEMSANGALFAELDAARAAGRQFRLHVVRPVHPLPLDPELFAGRVSTDSLMDMGYRDATAYLESMAPDGVAADETCTVMTEPPRGVRLRETLRGDVSGHEMTLEVTVELPLAQPGPPAPARLAGHVTYAPWGARTYLANGRVERSGPYLDYRAQVRRDGRWVDLEARRDLTDDPGLDAWSDMTTVEVAAATGESGRLRLRPADAARLVASAQPVGTHGVADAAAVLADLGRSGLRRVLTTYGT